MLFWTGQREHQRPRGTPPPRGGAGWGRGDTELYLSSLLGAPMELTNPHRKWFSNGQGVLGSGSGGGPLTDQSPCHQGPRRDTVRLGGASGCSGHCCGCYRVSLVAQLIKNLPALQEIPIRFLGQEDLLKKGYTLVYLGFPGGSAGKESALQCGRPAVESSSQKGSALPSTLTNTQRGWGPSQLTSPTRTLVSYFFVSLRLFPWEIIPMLPVQPEEPSDSPDHPFSPLPSAGFSLLPASCRT